MKVSGAALWARSVGDVDSHPFRRLVQAHGLSAAGDALVAVALAGSVFFSEDPKTARTKVALSLALTMAPFAVVAPFLGPAIDRLKSGRRVIMMGSSLVRAFVCLLMADQLHQFWLYPIAFAELVFSKTHAVTKSATVPTVVQSDTSLVRANSVLALTAVVAGFVAAALGYGVGQLGGGQWVLRLAALIFAAAAVSAWEVGSSAQPASDLEREALDESQKLQKLQKRKNSVLLAGFAMAALRFSVGFLTFLIAFDFRRRGAPTWWFGLPIGASMVGSSLGAVVAPHLRGRVREEHILTSAPVVVVVGAVLAAQHPGLAADSLLAAMVGLSASAGKLSFDSLVQRDAPSALQGRSFARFEAGFQMVWVVGALLPVVVTIDAAVGYWLLAVVGIATAVGYPLARHWPVPAALPMEPMHAGESGFDSESQPPLGP